MPGTVTVFEVFAPDQYELLDFGTGRKLERFGHEVLDRPSPAAVGTDIVDPELWSTATARFDLAASGKGKGKGEWDNAGLAASSDEEPWSVRHGDSRLIMGLNAAGNVGVFPEQADNWDWIAEQVRHIQNDLLDRRPRVLNLFAYTGGASLAAAAAGAEVAHVDSSGPTVAWAKKNAAASGMADLPIRWLVEDAIKFAARECRRGNYYDGVIADPPTYGHGPKGKAFKFGEHVGELMELCAELVGERGVGGRFVLFSCHAPGFGVDDAKATVSRALPTSDATCVTAQTLDLETVDGRKLSAGVSVRWTVTGGDCP